MTNPIQLSGITPKYLLETRRYLTLTVAIAIVSLLVVFIGIMPQIRTSLDLQQKSATEGKKLQAWEKKAQQLEQILTPEILSQIDNVNILLPSRKPLLELLSSLNLVANQAQVTFTGIEISPGSIATDSAGLQTDAASGKAVKKAKGKASSASDSLDMKITVQGSLANLNSFFELVERTAPLTTVTSLSLQPKAQTVSLTSSGSLSAPTASQSAIAQPYEADIDVSTAYFTQSISAAIDAALPDLNRSQQQIVTDLSTFTVRPLEAQNGIQGGGLQDLFGVTEPQVEAN